ncbi:MAG: hypothetical protein ACOY5R_06605 [Pseudomonadota bacterium]
MGKTTTGDAALPAEAGEATDWEAVALSLKDQIDALGAVMVDLGHHRPEGQTILVFAGDTITRLTAELGDALTTIAEIRNGENADRLVLEGLETEVAKVSGVLMDYGIELMPSEISRIDQLIALLAGITADKAALETKLGAATAKVETLEGKLEKAANPKAPKKKRPVQLALPEKAVPAIEAALTGSTQLVFSEDGGQVEDIAPIELSPADFRRDSGRALLTRRVEIDREAAPVRIEFAWLLADGKPVARCEIPGGLPAGGGRGAGFDAGHLIFA